MRSPTCDPQRLHLYKAEMEFYPKRKGGKSYIGELRWCDAAVLVRRVRAQFLLPKVRLKRARCNTTPNQAWVDFMAFDDGEIESADITLDTRHEHPSANTLLHELAHVITEVYFENVEDHGREFVGVVSWLYDYYQVMPADAFGVILRRHGVQRRPVRFCSPEILCD